VHEVGFIYKITQGCTVTKPKTHTTVGRNLLTEWSARRRENTQHLQDSHRTRNPSKPAAADTRLRPRVHWDPQRASLLKWNPNWTLSLLLYTSFYYFNCTQGIFKCDILPICDNNMAAPHPLLTPVYIVVMFSSGNS